MHSNVETAFKKVQTVVESVLGMHFFEEAGDPYSLSFHYSSNGCIHMNVEYDKAGSTIVAYAKIDMRPSQGHPPGVIIISTLTVDGREVYAYTNLTYTD